MQRIKITRNYKSYRAGDVLVLDNNVAFGLIDSGIAVLTKDMANSDYKIIKSDEGQADARTKVRSMRKKV